MKIFLASSSASRALLLENSGFDFEQIITKYDESAICAISTPAHLYAQAVVAEKIRQFKEHFRAEFFEFLKRGALLFADSSVICKNQILGKAKDENHARKMLELQSASRASVYTAMSVLCDAFSLNALSVASYDFAPYPADELENYLKSDLWQGKAGAMMIEGFSGKYILAKSGDISTAMGLDIPLLKRFFS